MLYDILPPAIFILSLGGVAVVVSRVALRTREEAFTEDIKNLAQKAAAQPTKSSVLKPSTKSIHIVADRLTAVKPVLSQAASSAWNKVRGISTSAVSRARKVDIKSKVSGIKVPKVSLPKRSKVAEAPVSEPAAPAIRAEVHEVEQVEQPEAVAAPSKPPITRRVITTATAPIKKITKDPEPEKSVIEQVEEAIVKSHYMRAEDLLVKHIMDNNKDIKAYMLLGEIAVKQQNWEEATEIFEQVIAWDSTHARAWVLLGDSAYRSGKLTRAIQALQQAHEYNPQEIAPLKQLMSIARQMDNTALQNSTQEKIASLKVADVEA